MNLCNDDHPEICFEARNCPLCEAVSNKDSKIDDLEREIKELELRIEELESEN